MGAWYNLYSIPPAFRNVPTQPTPHLLLELILAVVDHDGIVMPVEATDQGLKKDTVSLRKGKIHGWKNSKLDPHQSMGIRPRLSTEPDPLLMRCT